MLFASGQLGVSPDDSVPEDAEAQAVLCFTNIKAILAEANMTFDDVVRFTAYVTDRAYFPVYGAVRSRYVAGNNFASTLVICPASLLNTVIRSSSPAAITPVVRFSSSVSL